MSSTRTGNSPPAFDRRLALANESNNGRPGSLLGLMELECCNGCSSSPTKRLPGNSSWRITTFVTASDTFFRRQQRWDGGKVGRCTERGRWIRCSVIPHQLHKLIHRSVSGQSAEHRRAHPIAISTRAGCTSSVPVCRTCTTNQFMADSLAHWRSRRARRNTGDSAAAPPERCGDGNTNPDPSSSGLTSRSSATASTDSGTRCAGEAPAEPDAARV